MVIIKIFSTTKEIDDEKIDNKGYHLIPRKIFPAFVSLLTRVVDLKIALTTPYPPKTILFHKNKTINICNCFI